MKKRLLMLTTASLSHATWNPRTPDELSLDNPSMKELVASVSAAGIITPLAVWMRERLEVGEVDQIVIAGNRRLEAARAAGLDRVPAQVYTGITESFARKITRFENEVRRGVNPLEDAKLIESLVAGGASQKEIAAEFGVSEAMICRRMKLSALDPTVRAFAAEAGNITTDALESIASYPLETQRECLAAIRRRSKMSARVTWSDLQYDFTSKTRDLDQADFATDACVNCECRTGAQPTLFGELPEGAKLGRCLRCDCFERKVRAYHESLAEEVAGDALQVVDAESEGVDYWSLSHRAEFTKERSVSACALWWFYQTWNHEMLYLYGPTAKEYAEILEREDAERKAADEAEEKRRAENAERDAKNAARREELKKAADDATEIVRAAYRCAMNKERKFSKAIELQIVDAVSKESVSKAQRAYLRDCLFDTLCSYSFEVEEMLELLAAFPGFAKAIGVKTSQLKAATKTRAELAKFEREIKNLK